METANGWQVKGYEIKEIPVNREGLIGFEWFLGELSGGNFNSFGDTWEQ